jgi:hypothetical protein
MNVRATLEGPDIGTKAVLDGRREEARALLATQRDAVSRARRLYFDRTSFALDRKHDTEFEIKSAVANRYGVPFRSVVFAGSAQLGFSPQKDTLFVQGQSDLDVAVVDSGLFQRFWQIIWRVTLAFNDESRFKKGHAAKLRDQILRRGMILIDHMPWCPERTDEVSFMDDLGREHRSQFGRVSLAVYVNEYAFCWKQASVLSSILGYKDAK